MARQFRTPDEYQEMIDGFVRELRGLSERIAQHIDADPPADAGLIDALCNDVTRRMHPLFSLCSEINAARAAAAPEDADRLTAIEARRGWQQVTDAANRLRLTMNHWNAVRNLIADQHPRIARKLYGDPDRLPDTLNSQRSATDDLMLLFHAMFNKHAQDESARALGCFEDIALPNSNFMAHAHAAYRVALAQRRENPLRFLDVGCGGGIQVVSATRIFDRADGIEYDPGYAAAARAVMDFAPALADCTIFQKDALRFEGYADYDVVYFYRPMRDVERMHQLEKRIATCVRPGTILIAPYNPFWQRHAALGCGHVDGMVYVAGTPQPEADAIREKAERIGPYITRQARPGLPSIWDPIAAASRRNGYDFAANHARPEYPNRPPDAPA